MLSGKNFPQNMRAFRLVVEELLRDIIPTITKPVLIMMLFVGAEREADWRASLESNPPDLDPVLYGWSRDQTSYHVGS